MRGLVAGEHGVEFILRERQLYAKVRAFALRWREGTAVVFVYSRRRQTKVFRVVGLQSEPREDVENASEIRAADADLLVLLVTRSVRFDRRVEAAIDRVAGDRIIGVLLDDAALQHVAAHAGEDGNTVAKERAVGDDLRVAQILVLFAPKADVGVFKRRARDGRWLVAHGILEGLIPVHAVADDIAGIGHERHEGVIHPTHAALPHFETLGTEPADRTETLLKIEGLRPFKLVGREETHVLDPIVLILNLLVDIGKLLAELRVRLPIGQQAIDVDAVVGRAALRIFGLGVMIHPEISQLGEPIGADAVVEREHVGAELADLV